MSKKKEEKTKTPQANEPIVAYGSNRMHFFNSLEDQESDNYKWLTSLTPEQHLQNATQLIKRVFAEDLKKHPTIGNRITSD